YKEKHLFIYSHHMLKWCDIHIYRYEDNSPFWVLICLPNLFIFIKDVKMVKYTYLYVYICNHGCTTKCGLALIRLSIKSNISHIYFNWSIFDLPVKHDTKNKQLGKII